MIASPHKTIFTLLVCGLTLFNTTGAAQACWLTDWLWGHRNEAVPVAPPVITTGYAPAAYPVQTVNYQSAVCGPTCPPVAAPATTVGFLPRVDYQSQIQTVPTTVYRPVPIYQPNSAGVPVVGYQGCTTSRTQVQRVPTATFAPAATASSCGCASQGYSVQPMPSVSGGTVVPSTQPGAWVPRTEDALPATGGTLSVPQAYPQGQIQGQIQAAPSQGSYGADGSIYQNQPSTVTPAPMVQPQQQYIQQPQTQYQQQPQSQYQQQPQTQPMQPADQRPALRPELQQNQQPYQQQQYPPQNSQQNQNQQNGPELNGSNGNNGTNGNNGSNGTNGNTQGATSMVYPQPMQPAPGMMQRPAGMTVSPSSSSPASSWQVAPVTPIPDPEFSTSGPQDEAPQLLDPRDKTAGLDQSRSVVPVSYEMSRERPVAKPPTASIRAPQSQDSGWYSTGQ